MPRGEKDGASHLRCSTWSTGRLSPSPAPGVFLRELGGLDQFALGVLDLDRDGVDADQLLQPLAVPGVAFEPHGIPFDQQLQHHVP